MKQTIRVARINDNAIIPQRKNKLDAGLDLFSLESYFIPAFNSCILRTGIIIDLPHGYFGLIKPKSRNNYLIGGGVVDEGYTGEILVKVFNTNGYSINISKGDGIGQLILIPTIYPEVQEVISNLITDKESERKNTGGIVEQWEVGSLYPKMIKID